MLLNEETWKQWGNNKEQMNKIGRDEEQGRENLIHIEIGNFESEFVKLL